MKKYNFIYFPYDLFPFFQLLTESCAMNYCQDGLQVYFETEIPQSIFTPIYGHYELQPNDVNGRPYFRMGGETGKGIYWDGINSYWWIGPDYAKGQPIGLAYFSAFKGAFCPHLLSELHGWSLFDGTNWNYANNHLLITCKHIVIQIKQSEFRKLMIILMAF